MAFGFGFNKQKVLSSAEKHVQQGKFEAAITDYEKIIKEDPKDLTVLNTIGDLWSRVGEAEKAAGYFRKVGDAYAAEGFIVKAIAMYKKLTKLGPSASEHILKLAELYTQQGLYNDARAQYLLVADGFIKGNDLAQAAGILQKILALDPENANMQAKLADLYVRMGKKDQARDIFYTAATSLYQRGNMQAAADALKRATEINPNFLEAQLLRGRIAVELGDGATAVAALEKIPDIDSRLEGLRALMQGQILTGRVIDAEVTARKLLTVHNDTASMAAYAASLMQSGAAEAALAIYDQYADRLLGADSDGIIDSLHGSITKIKDNPAALERLRNIYQKAGVTTHLAEVTELLAHAYVQDDQLKKARDLFRALSIIEPTNPLHEQNYKQLVAKLGEDSAAGPLPADVGGQALMIDELEQQAPSLATAYNVDIRSALANALTDSELFQSYNQHDKAIFTLEAVLPKAPRDPNVHQRLAALYARANRFGDAAKCCDTLQSVFQEAGRPQDAADYADKAAKYRTQAAAVAAAAVQGAASGDGYADFLAEMPPDTGAPADAGAAPPPPVAAAPPPPPVVAAPVHAVPAEFAAAPPEFAAPAPAEFGTAPAEFAPAPEVPVEPAPAVAEFGFDTPAPVAPEAFVAEIPVAPVEPVVEAAAAGTAKEFDLSHEWDSSAAAPAEEPHPTKEAPAMAFAELLEEAKFYVGRSMWDEARTAVENLANVAPFLPEVSKFRALIAANTPPPVVEEAPVVEVAPPPPPPPPAPAPVAPEPVKEEKEDVLGDLVLDLEEALPADFGVQPGKAAPPPKAAAPVAPPPAPQPPPPAAVQPPPPPPVAPKPPAPVAPPPVPPAPAPVAHAEASSMLSDLFDEFKEDVEASSTEVEDPETHYNLGIAFKEMGLMDEAIGELQKVCAAIEHGHAFNQAVPAYTNLAHCFLEKGVHGAAVKWYQRALTTPDLDSETRLAVQYEMGAAYESAGDRPSALKSFSEVYASNIDYRDVAERIKALKS